MKLALSDNGAHLRFAPLSLTRPLGNLRVGILTTDERWKLYFPEAQIGYITESYLSAKYPALKEVDVCINALVIPTDDIVKAIRSLNQNQSLFVGDTWIARSGDGSGEQLFFQGDVPVILTERWDLFLSNERVIESDFQLITSGRKSQPISSTNTMIGDPSKVFVEEGAVVEGAMLNTTHGVVYIGKDAEVMEGSLIRGPFALCEYAAVKMGGKMYGGTTIGPYCKVGGEVSNSIFYAYSNKGHDGFVGNSLIGEWCNLGADTNTSNLKNNYGKVSTYSFEAEKEIQTDVQFMGLTMGDHSKCGINTMFNTAAVVGVSVNIFGSGFPSKFIPSFSWGGAEGIVPYRFEKATEYANAMMQRRNQLLSTAEIEVLRHIHG
jgi:UDP-N-acetylglucosamine diphosphorylase/glucosamine-1-phosphate N-acetyltransferase